MQSLADGIIAILAMFAPLFSRPAFEHVKVLLVGAILAPGRRTVAAVLRIMGLGEEPQFQKYHRVLNRARWSSRLKAGWLHRLAGFSPRGHASPLFPRLAGQLLPAPDQGIGESEEKDNQQHYTSAHIYASKAPHHLRLPIPCALCRPLLASPIAGSPLLPPPGPPGHARPSALLT